MSLRGFHIFFISLVVLFSFIISAIVFGLGFNPVFGVALAVFGVIAAVYGAWFIRKSRKLIL
jgi:uncharacterized membrane protein YqjE